MSIPANLAANPRLDRWVGFEAPGLVRVAFGKTEYGQGIMTALAQIAAEELDVGLDRLDVTNLETDLSPDEGLTVGSMSTETSGAAPGVRRGPGAVRRRGRGTAALRSGRARHRRRRLRPRRPADRPRLLEARRRRRPRPRADRRVRAEVARQASDRGDFASPLRSARQGVRRRLPARPCPARHAARARAASAGAE